jgi:hypothetical protein
MYYLSCMAVCMNMQKAGMIFPFPKKKVSRRRKKDQHILFRRAKEGNPFKFLVFEAGAVIPAKHIFQHQIESLAPCVELLCGGVAAPELIW